MIGRMAQMFLFGTEIDYEVSFAGIRVTSFRNPNVTDASAAANRSSSRDADEL